MDVAAHVERIADVGYTIVQNAIEADLRRELVDTLERLARDLEIGPADNDFEGQHTVRIYNLLVHGDVFARVPIHQHVLPIVEQVLDKECLLSSLSSIDIRPGETAQPIHADDMLMPIPKPHPATVCNTMWALTDFTEANGATRIIPGTHTEPGPDFGRHYESIAAEMPAGSVLIWHGSLWHGGGANTTSDERRVGIACNYCAGYIRQQENQQLGIPRPIARRLPRRLQRLVGYGAYAGLVGHIAKHDPIELLSEDGDLTMIWDDPVLGREMRA